MTNTDTIHPLAGGQDTIVGAAARYVFGAQGIESWLREVFRAVQTGPKAVPDSCTIGAGYLAGVQRQKADSRSGSAVGRLLGLRVRISPEAWMSVSCECCVLSGTSLCIGADHSSRGVLPSVLCV